MMPGIKKKPYNMYFGWMWIEILLLIFAVYVPFQLDMQRLSYVEVIHIALDWLAMFLLIIVLKSCIGGRKTKASSSFMKLIIVVYFMLFMEVGAWAFDRIAACRCFNYLCNIGCNSCFMLSALCYVHYVRDSLGIPQQKLAGMYRSVVIVGACGIAAEILNYPFGYFYRIDEMGVYIRSTSTSGMAAAFLPYIYILCCSVVLVIRQNMSMKRRVNYLLYAIIPIGISNWYMATGLPPSIYMSAFVAIMIIYGNIYIRQSEEIEQTILENARKDAELAWQRNQITLSQFRPHFIFNCLGSIEQLCVIDPDEAKNAMHRFSKYLRANMDALGEKKLIPLSKELEHIHNYVWLEKMRFEDELSYEEIIDTVDFYVPPLSVQPLVENAVKHGMMGMEEGILTVRLTVRENKDEYEICIEDDGNGFEMGTVKDDGRSHIGIRIVRESLDQSVNGKLDVESRIGEGTRAVIHIPKGGTS